MFDVQDIIGLGLVFKEDEACRMTIDCERGYVYAAADEGGEHFVAALTSTSAVQRRQLFKVQLPTLWVTDKEYSVRVGYDKLRKVFKILKPRKCEVRNCSDE